MADMRQIFTYPNYSGYNYIDPSYVGNATSGLTRRVDELLAGTYKAWTGLDPISDLSTTAPETMSTLSKYINYQIYNKSGTNLTFYDYWEQPMVVATRVAKAGGAPILSADVAAPATITTIAPHDFQDGMLIQIENFDGSWGIQYNGDTFYCKRLSSTTMQAARDSALTNLVGFQAQVNTTFDAGELDYQFAYVAQGGNVQINLTSSGITNVPDGTSIIFNTIANQGAGLIGTTYYMKALGVAYPNIFNLYEDILYATPLRLNRLPYSGGFAPLPTEIAVTINEGTNPATITTPAQLSANDLQVYVNTPKDWNDGVSRWNNLQTYYLKTTADVLVYEVYTDEAHTAAVNFDPSRWEPSSAYYFNGWQDVNISLAGSGPAGSVGLTGGFPSVSLPSTKQVVDGDTAIFSTFDAADMLNGGASLSGNTYYMKYYSTIPANAGYAIPEKKLYHLYEDAALTNQLLLTDLTMGSHTVTININDNSLFQAENKALNPNITLNPNDYTVGQYCLTSIAQEANADFSINNGTQLDWETLTVWAQGGAATIPAFSFSNALAFNEQASITTLMDNSTGWLNVHVYADGNNTPLARTLDPANPAPTDATQRLAVVIDTVQKNGQSLVGTETFLDANIYDAGTKQWGFNLNLQAYSNVSGYKEFSASDFVDAPYSFLCTPQVGSTPGVIKMYPGTVVGDEDLRVIPFQRTNGDPIGPLAFVSGNSIGTLPGALGKYYNLDRVGASTVDFTVTVDDGAGVETNVNWSGPFEFIFGPTGNGITPTFTKTVVTLNSNTYPDGLDGTQSYATSMLVTAGNYVTASSVFASKIYLKKTATTNVYELYKDLALTLPITYLDMDTTSDVSDETLTFGYEGGQYKVLDSAGVPVVGDVMVKFRPATNTDILMNVVTDIGAGTPYIQGSDGILYVDEAKTTKAITTFTPANIDEMVDSADHSFFPVAGGNKYWSEVKDDGNNIVLNDPNNAYYGAFTLDDYTDLELDPGETIRIAGVTQLPMEYVSFPVVGAIYPVPVPSVDNTPKVITALGTGGVPYTKNSKKLYKLADWKQLKSSSKNTGTGTSWQGALGGQTFYDPAVGTGVSGGNAQLDGLDYYKPYMFKESMQQQISGLTNGPGSRVGIKMKTLFNGAAQPFEWLFLDGHGFDTQLSPGPAGPVGPNKGAYFKANPDYVTWNSTPQQFPNVNKRSTQVTGFDFGEAIGFHNMKPWPFYSNSLPRPVDTKWERLGFPFPAPLDYGENNSEIFTANHFGEIAVRRFVIPKLKRYTINNLTEIRPYATSQTAQIEGVMVVPDNTMTTVNPYYDYFNSGDIIESENGSKWFMVKMHNEGSQITIANSAWQTDAVGSGPEYFNLPNYPTDGNTKTYLDIEGEEWCMYRMYSGSAPVDTKFDANLLQDKILERYTFTDATGSVTMMRPYENFTKGGVGQSGWTLLAENIATATPFTDAFYDTTTPETSFDIAINQEMQTTLYKTNTSGIINTSVTIDEQFSDLRVAPLNTGDITFKRRPWRMDAMVHKNWFMGDNWDKTSLPNRPLIDNNTVQSSIYTGAGTMTIGFGTLVASTTGTVILDPTEPNPYKVSAVDIVLPGNKKYSYQDTNNQTVLEGKVDTTNYWLPGSQFKSTLLPGETAATYAVTVDANGKLASVTLTDGGAYAGTGDQLLTLDSPANTYVPPTPTQAELEDVWDTDDEWASDGFTGNPNKEWPYHVTPMSAEINYSSPTIVNNSQSGVKYTRSAGHTKWTLDVVYPPMGKSDFQKFHAIAQAAHGQSTPFYFVLDSSINTDILWKDFSSVSSTNTVRFKNAIVPGDTLPLFEGFASNENAFIQGEVFIDGENENGSLHTSLSATDSNVFGEAKIRTPWPFRNAQTAGTKAYKNPYHAVVTLGSDNFEYSVDNAGYYYVSVSFDLDNWK